MRPGSQTFEQALFRLYQSGRITLEEAMSDSDSPTNLHWLINNAAKTAPRLERGKSRLRAAEPPSARSQPPQDLSSIKLNLDALG